MTSKNIKKQPNYLRIPARAEHRALLAEHETIIKRLLAITPDQVEQQALARFGPVPQLCEQCQQQPPRTIQIVTGRWLCTSCAGWK